MAAPTLTAGSLFAARWIVGGLLGQSASAEVYEVEEASQRRFAALKLYEAALALEPAFDAYARVTRAVSELPGEGIARAYDVGVESTLGRPFVASERITFPTLSRYVNERGPLPLRVLAPALTTLAGALDAAHAAGIVHGGLKPQNVFVSFDEPRWARITDFALGSLRAAAGRGPASLLGWSAPETAAGPSTPASDRYALALVCFFAATGIPWHNALHAVAEAERSRSRTRAASERAKSQGGDLDPLFDPWFERALAHDPNARFASAADMARAFVDLFTGAPTLEMPARSLPRPLAGTMPLPASQAPAAAPNGAARPIAATLPLPAVDAGSPSPHHPSAPAASAAVTGSFAPAVSAVPLRPNTSPGSTVPLRASALPASSVPPRPSALPTSSVPQGSSRSLPPVPKTRAPLWFWLACAAIALLAVLSIVWLSRY